LNTELSGIKKEKDMSIEALSKIAPNPVLKVNKKVYSGTRIIGTQATMLIKNDLGMSKFMEINTDDPENPKLITHQTLS